MAWRKNVSAHQAPSQSTLKRHIPKGLWVRKNRWLGALWFFMNPFYIILDCIFLYCVFLAVRGIFRFFKGLFSGNTTSLPTPPIPIPAIPYKTQEERYPYKKQQYLLTSTELKFYRVLKPICDQHNLAVFAKVRLEDLVYVPKEIFDNWKWRGYIRSRHIDFVLCDVSNLKIHCCLELDDWHHKFWKNQEIDERKNKILRDAGLSLIRIKASDVYDTMELDRVIGNRSRY